MSSRHRSDPAERGHWVLIGAMIATVVALAIIGGYSLYFALNNASPKGRVSAGTASVQPSSSPTTTGPPPALIIRVTGDSCNVFVGVPEGVVLANEQHNRGDVLTYDEPLLSVVVSDGSAVEVTINGEVQPPSEPGQRQTFTVKKKGAGSASAASPT